MQPTLSGLADLVLLPGAVPALVIGVLIGVFVGVMPGLSARSSLLIAIPFVLSQPPLVAAIFLVAMHASSHVSSSVPAVVFGAPTSASEAATAQDGYPLALAGEGARAVGAILSANALGGILGAVVLLAFGAIAAKVIAVFGSPELAALASAGLLAIAAVSDRGLAAGLAMGAAGVLVSTVGLGHFSLEPRFTMGIDALFDGISAPALIAGLMAIPELLRRQPEQAPLAVRPSHLGVLRGIAEPYRHLGLTLRSTLIGLFVGLTPGIGSSIAVWLSYIQARKTTRSKTPFGTGAIEGIVAPEAAAGAKEGGALIPTLFLGVPGSSGMAILIIAFTIVGIATGPVMMLRQPGIPASIAGAVILANVLGLLACFAAAPWIVRLAALPRRFVVGLSLTAASTAAYFADPGGATAIQILVFSVAGIAFAWAGLSRPAFLIGFVVGPVFEASLIRSNLIYGWSAILRPGVVVIVVVVLLLGWLFSRGQRSTQRRPPQGPSRSAVPVLLALAAASLAALLVAPRYGANAAFLPMVAAGIALLAAVTATVRTLRAPARSADTYRLVPATAATLAVSLVATALFGPIALAISLLGSLFMRRAPKAESA